MKPRSERPRGAGRSRREVALGAGLALEGLRVAHAAVVGHVFRLGQFVAQEADQGGGELFGRDGLGELLRDALVFVGDGGAERRVGEQALAVLLADFLGGRRAAPGRFDVGGGEHLLGAAALGVRDEEDGHALLAGAAGAARAVEQGRLVGRQVGVDDEAEVGQVEAAGGDVGGDADLGVAVAQGLQRIVAFALVHFAGEADGVEAALAQGGVEVAHGFARGAEDEGAGRLRNSAAR